MEGAAAAAAILLKHGASVNVPLETWYEDEDNIERGFTALHCASLRGDASIVTLLLKHGAQIDRPTWPPHLLTPLHLAAANGHTQVCVALVRAGADTSALTGAGETALAIARRNGITDVENALRVQKSSL
jgi:ankyrin repeat protein